jgi:hypothetical protein
MRVFSVGNVSTSNVEPMLISAINEHSEWVCIHRIAEVVERERGMEVAGFNKFLLNTEIFEFYTKYYEILDVYSAKHLEIADEFKTSKSMFISIYMRKFIFRCLEHVSVRYKAKCKCRRCKR